MHALKHRYAGIRGGWGAYTILHLWCCLNQLACVSKHCIWKRESERDLMIWHLSQILTFWCWKFTFKPMCWLCDVFVSTGWLCQMLWIYRSEYRQSVCCENYSTHSRLQTSPKRKGVFLSHSVTRLLTHTFKSTKLLVSCFTDWQRNWTAQSPSPQTHCPVLLPLRRQGQHLHPSRALQQTSESQHNIPMQTPMV